MSSLLYLNIMTIRFAKNWKSICHSFMDSCRRHRTPLSATNDLHTAQLAAELPISISYSCLFSPIGIRQMQAQVDAMHVVVMFHSLKTLSLIKTQSIKNLRQTCSTFAPEGDTIFITVYNKQICAPLQMKRLPFSFRDNYIEVFLKRWSRHLSMPLFTKFAKMWDTRRNFFPVGPPAKWKIQAIKYIFVTQGLRRLLYSAIDYFRRCLQS